MVDIKKATCETKLAFQNPAHGFARFELGDPEPSCDAGLSQKDQVINKMRRMFGFTPTQAEASFVRLPNTLESRTLDQILDLLSRVEPDGKNYSVADVRRMFEGLEPLKDLPPIVAMADFKRFCGKNNQMNFTNFADLAKRLGINDTHAVRVVFDEISQGNSGLDAQSFVAAFGGDRVAKAAFTRRFNEIKDRAGKNDPAKQNSSQDGAKTSDKQEAPSDANVAQSLGIEPKNTNPVFKQIAQGRKTINQQQFNTGFGFQNAIMTGQNNDMLFNTRRSFERSSTVPDSDLLNYKDKIVS
jgi:hypothetical protein